MDVTVCRQKLNRWSGKDRLSTKISSYTYNNGIMIKINIDYLFYLTWEKHSDQWQLQQRKPIPRPTPQSSIVIGTRIKFDNQFLFK